MKTKLQQSLDRIAGWIGFAAVLVESKLDDGTPVYAESIEIGKSLWLDAEGTTPAPEGDHLASGSIITVDANGIIVDIKPQEVQASLDDVLESSDSESSDSPDLVPAISEILSVLKNLDERLTYLEAGYKGKDEEMSSVKEELAKFSALASTSTIEKQPLKTKTPSIKERPETLKSLEKFFNN